LRVAVLAIFNPPDNNDTHLSIYEKRKISSIDALLAQIILLDDDLGPRDGVSMWQLKMHCGSDFYKERWIGHSFFSRWVNRFSNRRVSNQCPMGMGVLKTDCRA
jgi:hypothetical protein